MTLADKFNMYFAGKLDALSLIRQLSGMFDPKQAVDILTLICTITRHEQGDIDEDTFRQVWKLPTEVEVMFRKGADYPQEYDEMSMKDLKKELERMVTDLERLQKKKLDTPEPIIDENGISIETDIIGLAPDVSLLTTYITYRMKKDKDKDVSNGK